MMKSIYSAVVAIGLGGCAGETPPPASPTATPAVEHPNATATKEVPVSEPVKAVDVAPRAVVVAPSAAPVFDGVTLEPYPVKVKSSQAKAAGDFPRECKGGVAAVECKSFPAANAKGDYVGCIADDQKPIDLAGIDSRRKLGCQVVITKRK